MSDTSNRPGPARFEFYLSHVEALLAKAAARKNPAWWLYQNNLRTPLFMLEGLAKLYAGLHNEKKFSKIKAWLKEVEDLLGAIDYYDQCAIALKSNPKIPASYIQYLVKQTKEKTAALNTILVDRKWLGDDTSRIAKIRGKLEDAKWLKAANEIEAISNFYGQSIYQINEFVQERKFVFTHMETEVHELRRKLRWLSIYPQALQGAIQLQEEPRLPKPLSKYLTKAIVTSPFNQMPAASPGMPILLLHKNRFLALSWMINDLGRIKDQGLLSVALAEAIQHTDHIDEASGAKAAAKLLGKKVQPLDTLLTEAATVCKTYFDEHNLEQLVKGPGEA